MPAGAAKYVRQRVMAQRAHQQERGTQQLGTAGRSHSSTHTATVRTLLLAAQPAPWAPSHALQQEVADVVGGDGGLC